MPMSAATPVKRNESLSKTIANSSGNVEGSVNLSNILVQGNFSVSFFDQLKKCPIKEIYVLEGRPSLKAVKDSTRELNKRGFTPTVIADNMAGYLFYKNLINEVWIACQPIDKEKVMCDVGALVLAVLAKKHHIPVYAFKTKLGKKSSKAENDLTKFNGRQVLKTATKSYVPLTETVAVSYLKGIYG